MFEIIDFNSKSWHFKHSLRKLIYLQHIHWLIEKPICIFVSVKIILKVFLPIYWKLHHMWNEFEIFFRSLPFQFGKNALLHHYLLKIFLKNTLKWIHTSLMIKKLNLQVNISKCCKLCVFSQIYNAITVPVNRYIYFIV